MKRIILRMLCILLCLCMLPAAPVALADEESDAYRDRVLTRYDFSFKRSNYYENLRQDSDFLYEQWAAAVGDMPSYAQFFTDLSNVLLDKPLDEEAYTEYLMKLLKMVEEGFTDTAASQAKYTARVNGADVIDGGITIISKVLPDGGALEVAGKVLEYVDSGFDLARVLAGTVNDVGDLAIISAESALHREKMYILQMIAAHAEDPLLKKAAESLQTATDVQFIQILQRTVDQDMRSIFREVVMNGYNIKGYAELLPKLYNASFSILLQQADKLVGVEDLDKVLKVSAELTKDAVAFLVPVVGGVVVGSEIMKLVVGDEAECYREMQAMSEIATALSKGFEDAKNLASGGGDEQIRYEAVEEFVALGEALAYARLRGDYCFVLSSQLFEIEAFINENPHNVYTSQLSLLLDSKDEFGMDRLVSLVNAMDTDDVHIKHVREVAEYYGYLEQNLAAYCEVLAGIFPDDEQQIIVTAALEATEADRFYSAIYVPHVEVVGDEELTAKINAACDFDTLAAGARSTANAYYEIAQESSDSYAFSQFTLDSAVCVGDALNLQMSSLCWASGAIYFDGEYHESIFVDTTTGERITLQDLLNLDEPDAKERLIDVLARYIEKDVGWVFSTFRKVAESLADGTEWSDVPSLTKEGLLLHFSAGEITPMAGGSQRVLIPYSELKGIIQARFLPDDLIYTGDIRFYLPSGGLPEPEVRRVHGNKSLEAIHVISDVYDVRVQETRYPEVWVTEWAQSYSGIVFYANYLTNEMYWVPENAGGSYMLYYNDESVYLDAE